MKLEELLEKHRPAAGTENGPASPDQAFHLNYYGLMEEAVEVQLEKDAAIASVDVDDLDEAPIITKQTAWEILAEAQREGLRVRPISELKKGGGMRRRRVRS